MSDVLERETVPTELGEYAIELRRRVGMPMPEFIGETTEIVIRDKYQGGSRYSGPPISPYHVYARRVLDLLNDDDNHPEDIGIQMYRDGVKAARAIFRDGYDGELSSQPMPVGYWGLLPEAPGLGWEFVGFAFINPLVSIGYGPDDILAPDSDFARAVQVDTSQYEAWVKGEVFEWVALDPDGVEIEACGDYYGLEFNRDYTLSQAHNAIAEHVEMRKAETASRVAVERATAARARRLEDLRVPMSQAARRWALSHADNAIHGGVTVSGVKADGSMVSVQVFESREVDGFTVLISGTKGAVVNVIETEPNRADVEVHHVEKF